MGTKLRAALLGCGKIGSDFADGPNREQVGIYSHAEAYAVNDRAELIAVCDRNVARAEACGRRWGVEGIYTDARLMLAEAMPDLVSICTPDGTHQELGMAAVAGDGVKGVLMEKPLSGDLVGGEALVVRAEELGVQLAVNYSRRYAQSFAELQEFIAGGGIGEIQFVQGYYTKGLIHNGTHWIDLLRFLCGEITSITALEPVANSCGKDPTIAVRFRLEGGGEAVLSGLDHRSFTLFEMDLVGTRGRVRIVDSGHRFEVWRAAESRYYSGYVMLEPAADPIIGGMRDVTANAVGNLIDAITGSAPLRCSGRDGLAALRWALEGIASARSLEA